MTEFRNKFTPGYPGKAKMLREIRKEALMNLVENIDNWGIIRNITHEGGATAQAQIDKLLEEVSECIGTLLDLHGSSRLSAARVAELQDRLEDDFGDMLVCILQAIRLSDTDIISCLSRAWSDIKDRKGTMVAGKFVKDS